jgi:hypothetical protein
MEEFSYLEEDCLLKGTLVITVLSRHDGRPLPGKVVRVLGCGFG